MTSIPRLLAVLLLVAFAGCTGWRQSTLPALENGPVSIRAARLTPREPGTVTVLRDVQVTADSVIGWGKPAVGPEWHLPDERTRVAVPRGQVLFFETRGRDPWRTAGVAVLVVVAAYGAAVWHALNDVVY